MGNKVVATASPYGDSGSTRIVLSTRTAAKVGLESEALGLPLVKSIEKILHH